MSDRTTAWLDHAQALDKAATEGPWIAEYSGEQGNCVIPHDAQSTREAVAVTRLYHQTGDAEWIAFSRTGLTAAVAALTAVRELHEPIHALDYGAPVRGGRLTHVCTGCGQDNGNWQYWPCPTIAAIDKALEGPS